VYTIRGRKRKSRKNRKNIKTSNIKINIDNKTFLKNEPVIKYEIYKSC